MIVSLGKYKIKFANELFIVENIQGNFENGVNNQRERWEWYNERFVTRTVLLDVNLTF